MLLDIYIILFLLGLGSLIAAVKTKRLLLAMFATVMFFTLALQAFTIEFITSAGVTVVFQEPVVVLLNWFLAFLSTVIFFVGLAGFIKDRMDKKTTRGGWGMGLE